MSLQPLYHPVRSCFFPRYQLTQAFLVAATMVLSSCTGLTLRAPFRGYSRAYADAMNEQLLLNLARLDNGHPAYHLAIGTINNKMTLSAEAGGSGSQNETDSTTSSSSAESGATGLVTRATRSLQQVASAVTSGSLNTRVSGTATPDFQLIPLNNEAIAAQLLKPIPADVFYTLYQQGYPVDQLLRVLIERIEATLPNGKHLTLFNSPLRGSSESYVTFLRTCAVLRELQRTGALQLVTTSEPDVISIFTSTIPPKQGKEEKSEPQSEILPFELPEPATSPKARSEGNKAANVPSASDVFQAESRGWSYQKGADGKWLLTRERYDPYFTIRATSRHALIQQMNAAGISQPDEVVSNLHQMLEAGIHLKTNVEGKSRPGTSRLILRSYTRILEAVATEQNGFEILAQNSTFRQTVPVSQLRPILRTRWQSNSAPLQPALQQLLTQGKVIRLLMLRCHLSIRRRLGIATYFGSSPHSHLR